MLQQQPVHLVLASGSAYRATLLRRLGLEFSQHSPDVDESAQPGEHPIALVHRLARLKAEAVARITSGIVIGSDQIAVPGQLAEPDSGPVSGLDAGLDSNSDAGRQTATHAVSAKQILGKPGSVERACEQLHLMAGGVVTFLTAVFVLDASTGKALQALDTTHVTLRVLDAGTISRYVNREQPLDCAGSFKAEGLGIGLFERIDSQDPTALVGLPLIATARMLRNMGYQVP